MPWLSAGKPIAAVAIAQLWERGLLDLDDKVAKHLPAFAVGGKENITIRHILTHTAGFRAVIGPNYENQPWDKIIADLCATKLEPGWIVGQTAGYHPTTSWYILGELVRLLDGRPFDLYAREMIFSPVGMRDSHFALSADQYQAYGDRIGLLNDPAAHHPPSAAWMDDAIGASRVRPGTAPAGPIRELGLLLRNPPPRRHFPRRQSHPLTASESKRSRRRIASASWTKRSSTSSIGPSASSHNRSSTAPTRFPTTSEPKRPPVPSDTVARAARSDFCDPEHALVVALVLSRAANEMEHHLRMREIYAALGADLQLGASTDATPTV